MYKKIKLALFATVALTAIAIDPVAAEVGVECGSLYGGNFCPEP
ncbi:hypothetical protein [Halorussus amylolyticus]|nr:hypothetical protein [Halorussus amylolyticus]